MTAKTTAERQRALRQARAAAGLVRLELWAHPDDHPALKAEAAKLAKRREKKPARGGLKVRGPRGAAEKTIRAMR